MAKFLICTMPFAGHVNPGLPVARALVARGHQVWWYTGARFREAIEATGAHYLHMRAASDIGDRDFRSAFPDMSGQRGRGRRNAGLKRLFLDPIPGQVDDLRHILRDFPADVVLSDSTFGGAGIAHELGGPPWATLSISALTITSRDTAPFNTLLPPSSSPLGHLRNQLLNMFVKRVVMREAAEYLDELRATLGLPARGASLFDLISPYLFLQTSTPAFEYPRGDLPPQVHFIGPLLFEPATPFAPPSWWGDLRGPRPVVLVNQGTIANQPGDLIAPSLGALAGEDLLVVATTGGKPVEQLRQALAADQDAELLLRQARMLAAVPAVMGSLSVPPSVWAAARSPATPGSGSLPRNARVEPFIPFAQLMPHVDVMITNGGFGGVQFALAHGIPLVVAGGSEEKPEIAARVAWSGAGINLRTGHPTPEQIRAAVREVLRNPSYRRNAERIRDDYRRHDAPAEAAALLEQLAATGRPVLRAAPVSQPSTPTPKGRPRTSARV